MHDIYMINDRYEILENKNGDCYIKDLTENKYYFKPEYYASKKAEFKSKSIKWSYKDTFCLTSIIISVVSFIILCFSFDKIFYPCVFTSTMYIIAVEYLIMNVVLHEIGHTLTLKLFGRKGGKVKFKFNFIYPTFAIDTTDSYVLPKYRRIFIYYAGIMVNILICMITYLLFPNHLYLLRSVMWLIIFNLIPIGGIKTDGYHIFITSMLNIKDYKSKKSIFARISKAVFIIVSILMIFISIYRNFMK